MTEGVQGLAIGDKGYISAFLQAELATTGIDLQTPLRASFILKKSGHAMFGI